MKSLQQLITESLDQQLFEAFQSTIIRDIINKSDKYLFKELMRVGLAWSEIKDSDLEEVTPLEGKRGAMRGGFTIFTKGGKLIGAGLGNWIKVSNYWRGKSEFSSVTAMSKEADNAYLINVDKWNSLNQSFRDSKQERWAMKSDAEAFKTNEQILRDNKDRWAAIMAEKLLEKDDTEKVIKEIFDSYSKTFDKLQGAPDWYQIKTLGEDMKKLMELYGDYIWQKRKNSLDVYAKNDLDKTINSVKILLQKVNKQQEEQGSN